jgi:hypothetical protein
MIDIFLIIVMLIFILGIVFLIIKFILYPLLFFVFFPVTEVKKYLKESNCVYISHKKMKKQDIPSFISSKEKNLIEKMVYTLAVFKIVAKNLENNKNVIFWLRVKSSSSFFVKNKNTFFLNQDM